MRIIPFYRVNDWAKSLGFSILGLVITEFILVSNPTLFFLGLAQTIFLFSFLFSFNDLTDFIIRKEKNYIGILIERSILSIKSVVFLCFLPLLLSTIPLLLNFSTKYFVFYIFFILLSFCYSAPKIRLRDIPIVDLICNILFFSLIFLQSYFFINKIIVIELYFFLFWIVFYIFSQEIIHQISHLQKDKKSGRKSTILKLGTRKSICLIKFSFLLSVIFGILLCFLFKELKLFASIMIMFSFLRLFYIIKLDKNSSFKKLRNNLGGVLEGLLYLILNIMKL